MEAETLPSKKKSIALTKGKLKKTIKNVICRPDPVFWPTISDENEKVLRVVLSNHKVDIPPFTKPHWKELKEIPKEKRPKPPKIEKPNGLLFGLSNCQDAIKNSSCSAVLIDSEVNPRLIVQPLIEMCIKMNVPVLCLKHLRKLTCTNFGIKTTCLGITDLPKLKDKIYEFASTIKKAESAPTNESKVEEMDTETEFKPPKVIENKTEIKCLHLFRTNKKTRVFIPPSEKVTMKQKNKFTGQDFIEFSEKPVQQGNHKFKNMMLKRITSNPNRNKAGKKRKN